MRGMGGIRRSPRVFLVAAIACALAAGVAAAAARTVVFDLKPEDPARSTSRFAGARDVELDPRLPWARIPEALPGGEHALRLRLGRRPARRLVLYLDTREQTDGLPARLTVSVNAAAVATVEARSGPAASRESEAEGVSRRYRVFIPATALGDGGEARLTIVNVSGASVVWRQIRLVEGRPTLTWAHLRRRGAFPREGALFLVGSLAALALANLVAVGEAGWRHRAWAVAGPATGLLLLAAGYVATSRSAPGAGVPRWLWLLAPWLALLIRPRPRVVGAGRARAWRLATNGALALVSLALSLAAAELALRWVYRDVTSAGDTGSYFHRIRFESNSLGFREREFSRAKPPGTYRLAVVGDSLTFGHVADAERFTNRLERFLNERRPPGRVYEVLNFGRPGWDTVHEVRVLRKVVLDTDPDFVLLQWYVNDVENGDHSERPRPWPLLWPVTLHWKLQQRSALYPLLDVQWVALQEQLGLIEPHSAHMLRRFGDPEGPDAVYATDRLREFIATGRAAGRPVGLVLFPRVGPDLARGAYEYGYLHDRVLEVCRQEGIGCLDLRAAFAAHADYKRLWATPLDGHPSALANRLAAEQLMAAFGPAWLGVGRRAP